MAFGGCWACVHEMRQGNNEMINIINVINEINVHLSAKKANCY